MQPSTCLRFAGTLLGALYGGRGCEDLSLVGIIAQRSCSSVNANRQNQTRQPTEASSPSRTRSVTSTDQEYNAVRGDFNASLLTKTPYRRTAERKEAA
jgi:hypothetical protein